jgi:hypothetical protein
MPESHKSPVSFSMGSPQGNAIEPGKGRGGAPCFGGNGEKRFPAPRLGPCVRRAPLFNPRAIRAREIRGDLFAVLGTVAAMIPSSGDVEGRAAGVLTVADIAERSKVSRNKVKAALKHFRAWRVLWVQYQAGSVEIRFQRQVAVGLLAAQRVCPFQVKRLMAAHRRRREAIAPFHKSVAAAATSTSPSPQPGRAGCRGRDDGMRRAARRGLCRG